MVVVVMPRRLVDEDAELYRAVVVTRRMERNPDWVPGKGLDWWVPTDGTTTNYYGPYSKLGTARGVRTQETTDYMGETLPSVVSSHIEKATVTWSVVDE